MKTLAMLFLMALSGSATLAATITGTVKAEGKAGADADALCGKYDSRQFKFVERVNYSEMRDFIVFIEGPITGSATVPEQHAQIVTDRVEQKGATFLPHVLPVLAGTTVEWPNNDEILHNVFSFSEGNKFDLGLYKAPKIEKVKFEKPGRVDVFCSIHSRMSCIVLVLENPFFAATDDKGRFKIPNVPSGVYKLKAWHERLPSQSVQVTIPETGEIKVDFTLGIKGLAKN
jgi:plastocyanin